MQSERRRRILSLVAQAYIETARPVPSAHVAGLLRISSATVRNEFKALEEQGLLLQQHVSSGRIPSTDGLNFYASYFIPPGTLPLKQRHLISSRLGHAHGDLLLQGVAQLAAELSGYAVVVRLNPDDALHTLAIHLNVLSADRLLAVVVLENGLVRQQVLELSPLPDPADLDEAGSRLRGLSVPLRDLARSVTLLAGSGGSGSRRVLQAVAAAAGSLNPERLFTYGLGNLLSEPEAQDPDFLRTAVREVETPPATALDDTPLALVLDDATARVRAALPLGRLQAELNLIGPARMRYPEAFRVAGGLAAAVSAAASRPVN